WMSRRQTSLPSMVRQVRRPFPVITHTLTPSVMGDGEAEFCLRKSWFPASTSRFHRMLPSLRSRAIRKILSAEATPAERGRGPPPSSVKPSCAEVTNTVSPQTIGVAALQLGSRARQRTLSFWLHVTGRSRALALLPPEFTRDPDRKARFIQEARAAAAVNHPAIAQIYDVDEDESGVFIAMELVPGKTVKALIQGRELDLLGALEVGVQVAGGLHKAHEAGIVHRDINPETVSVTPDGRAELLAFCLAKLRATT